MDWQQERRSFWERICVAHVASYALAEQPVAMADRLVRAWEERFPRPAPLVRYDPTKDPLAPPFTPTPIVREMVDIPVAEWNAAPHSDKINIRKPYQCPDCGGYAVGGGCTCSLELRRQRWEESRTGPYGPNEIIGKYTGPAEEAASSPTPAKPIDPVDAILNRFGVK